MSFNFGQASGSSSSSLGGSSSAPSTSSTSSRAPSGGFSFGATSDAAPATSTGFSFTSAAAPSSSGLSFGAASTAPDTSKNTAASSSGFSFGVGAKSAPTTATSSTGAATGSGFSFGAKMSAAEAKPAVPASLGFSFSATSCAEAKSLATTAAPASKGDFSFGATTSDATKPADVKPVPAAPATKFSFGGPSATAPSAVAESKTETRATPSFGIEISPTLSDTGMSTAATSSTTTSALTAPVMEVDKPPAEYMGRTIEDIINAWSEQLERNADTFTTEAVKVSKWDSDLMDCQKKLGDIAGDVRRIQVAQNELDTNLDTVFAYQMELKSTLEQLEKSVDKMYESQDQMPVAADIEREQTLQLSVDIDDQLNSMTTTLKETVEKLNKAENDVADENNPMVQIMKVLNVHHNSLQWIEGSAGRINNEIAQLSRKLQSSSI